MSSLIQNKKAEDITEEEGVAEIDKIMGGNEMYQKQIEEPETIEYGYTQLKAINDDPSQLEGFIMEDNGIPLNMRFLQTKAVNDDPSQMEGFIMEDAGIPLNMRMV